MIASALHIGINKYPDGYALAKCVNDARGFAKLFRGKLLLDSDCIPSEVLSRLKAVALGTAKNRWGVVTYSGHGTPVPDTNNDEGDGYDEAMVAVNLEYIVDDLIRIAIKDTKGPLLLIADSCYSGGYPRAIPALGVKHTAIVHKNRMRYMPLGSTTPYKRVTNATKEKPPRQVVIISGCTDFEFSYEGKRYGILTGALLQTYRRGMTIEQWYNSACKVVAKSGYNQHPQLICSRAARKWRVPEL